MRRVRLISLGITILPKSSTLLTMPVAFIYLSPFLQRRKASLVQREVAARRADGGIVFIVHHNPPVSSADSPLYTRGAFSRAYNNFTNYAVSICKRQEIILRESKLICDIQ